MGSTDKREETDSYEHHESKGFCQVRWRWGDVEGWDDVSVIYLGYPIWWMDMPQVIKSFIANHDWTGKTVVPFSTYYSSGWAGTPDKIAETCAGAKMAEGLSLGQNDLPGAYDQVEGWLAGLA